MADPKLTAIQERVTELEGIVNAEQEQIKTLLDNNQATITGLNAIITDLQAQVADGGTAEERQAILDKLQTIKTDIENTVADAQASPEVGDGGGGEVSNG